jgi:polyisoprenoid-binding protein YceI
LRLANNRKTRLRVAAAEKNTRNMGRVMDSLTPAAADSTTNVAELFEGIRAGGAFAATAGASLETFVALQGVLANKGVKGAEAGTAIRNSYLHLTKQTDEAREAQAALGVQTAKNKDGSIDLIGDKAETSRVRVGIDMKSVFTDTDQLTGHLQTGDFFEVEKHPKSTFVSTKIEPDTTKGANSYTVTGDLEMRGVKKSISFPATIVITPTDVTVNSEFAINRKDFGIVYAGKADDLIRNDVVVKLDLKALRQK